MRRKKPQRRKNRYQMVALGVLLTGGCAAGPHIMAPQRESLKDLGGPEEPAAFTFLASNDGPLRFARVAEGIYRGGQPNEKQLEALYALGVHTIINLRREEADTWQQEERQARALGMEFLHYPFYGVFGADELFLKGIVAQMKAAQMKPGAVYIHCKHGRDRTSLLVALYRVMVERWEPRLAWKLEAIDYGSAQTYFYRQLRLVFERMAKRQLPALAESATDDVSASDPLDPRG